MSNSVKLTLEQRANIKLCAKLNMTSRDTCKLMQQVHGIDLAVEDKTVSNWYTVFNKNQQNIL
ncbi:hypothetical protein X777_10844 [Ooceraea biroi]|uniref:Mos1 transposase HTH domain-containing protein n=1 Tax=Ooceraea biroi TaxID=2015173 RepID=A0A026W6Z1_OOCBI|nr:hypothetical protein X777_10844 [Ooceraea biroi]